LAAAAQSNEAPVQQVRHMQFTYFRVVLSLLLTFYENAGIGRLVAAAQCHEAPVSSKQFTPLKDVLFLLLTSLSLQALADWWLLRSLVRRQCSE
jgi:hypothetical protein